MSVWAALVVLTSAALASVSWLAARSLAYVVGRHGARMTPQRQIGVRQGCWAVFGLTATGIGVAVGHPFAITVFLVPAMAID